MTGSTQLGCEWVELYALGALEEQERVSFEAHLAGCSVCARELEGMMPVVNALPWSADQIDPPPGMKARVWGGVLERIREETANEAYPHPLVSATDGSAQPVQPQVHQQHTQQHEHTNGQPQMKQHNSQQTPPPLWQVQHAAPRSGRRLSAILGSAAAVLLIVCALLLQQVNRLDADRAELATMLEQLEEQVLAMGNPSAPLQVHNVVALSPAAENIVAQGLATIVIDDKGTHLIVQAEQMPALQNDEAFQVWLLKDGTPVNAGTFLTHNGTGALYFTFSPDTYDTIAITHEPDPDGQLPRGEIVLAAPLLAAEG